MKIMILGDAMTDIDIHCEIVKWNDVSPVLREISRIERPGGAANVQEMCRALGSEVQLIGNVPNQRSGAGPFSPDEEVVKRRFLVDGKVVFRHDTESRTPFDWPVHEKYGLCRDVLKQIDCFSPDAIVIADHGKGFVTTQLMQALDAVLLPIFIDPVATTPVIHGDRITWIGSGSEIPREAHRDCCIKKYGPEGLSCLVGGDAIHFPAACNDPVDDIGAGDQFLASLVVNRLSGLDWKEAVRQANEDAGEQCHRLGIVPIQRALPCSGKLSFREQLESPKPSLELTQRILTLPH